MNIPRFARYSMVIAEAYRFLRVENITTFPFDPLEIIERHGWGIVKYSELMKKHGLPLSKIVEEFESEDGFTIYNNGMFCIAYNDKIYSENRQRFTLMHEIGHIYLRHFVDFDMGTLLRRELSDAQYRVLENESNSFARNALAPITLMDKLKLINEDTGPQRIKLIFALSKPASETRVALAQRDYADFIQEGIFDHFNDINVRLTSFYVRLLYIKQKQCKVCGHCEPTSFRGLCRICGGNQFKKVSEKMLYYGIEIDNNSRALRCPYCDNEHVESYGDYCQICGHFIVNRCTNNYEVCGITLSGDSRYCPTCGAVSTFFVEGYLKSYSGHPYQNGNDTRAVDFDNRLSPQYIQDFDDVPTAPYADSEDDEYPF